MKHGKKYVESAKLVDKAKLYEVAEALELATKTASAKFDETVEMHIRLGVDSRHADQQVRGAVVLPNGTGKNVRVAVFAKGDAAKAADELRGRRAVILNMENVDKALTRRVVDFLSGCVYALDGQVKKVAQSTYLFCPHSMDIVGDLETFQAEAESYV